MTERRTLQQILTPPVKTRTIFTFADFADTVKRTWELVYPHDAEILHAYPLQDESFKDIKSPIIDYLYLRKFPTEMGSEQEIKPRPRAVISDPLNPQQTSTIFAQRFTYLVDFGIWDVNWPKVERLQEKFEDFMLTYTGVFKELGVSELIYQEATEDVPRASVQRADLASSHVIYRVDIEKTVEVFNQVVETIKVKLKKQEEN